MARPKTLSAAFVRTITAPGRYGDGRGGCGLSVLVKPMSNGRTSRTWAQRIIINGKPVSIGLGSFPRVALAEARAAALANAREVAQGRDPRGGGIPTFSEAVKIVIKMHEPTWRNGTRTAATWRQSLKDHAGPKLGNRRVDQIQVQHVLEALVPIWHVKYEVARKVRQRISTVMKWAVAQGYRQDDPAGPAINAALPRGATNGKHHRALDYREVAVALAIVDASQAWPTTKLCINMLVLTAARSGEARGARWEEFDMDAREWRVPAGRMKTGVEHRVPLCRAAMQVLQDARQYQDGSGLVFPSRRGRPLSDATLSKLIREIGIDAVPHGFRSSFRDWCAETGQSREIAEAALAHVVPGIEGAYFRTDLFQQRRKLMDEWGAFISAC